MLVLGRQFFVVLILSMAIATAAHAQPQVQWQDGAQVGLEGRGWTDTPTPFCRLPVKAEGVVPGSVWGLAQHSAGMAVRFRTDSPTVSVRWSLTSPNLAMPHMPATGVSGVDLYARDSHGRWVFVQNGRPGGPSDNMTTFSLGDAGATGRECLLYLPLYNGVKSLEIGVPAGRKLEPAPARPSVSARPIVVYGTSIAQGGCASRPGMAWPAIVGRDLDRPVINLGFSGSGRMEPEMATTLAELDPAVFVVDCLWNMGGLAPQELRQRIENLARTLRRAHPDTPILFVGQSDIRCAPTTPSSKAQEDVVRKLQAEGMRGLAVLAGRTLVGTDGEGTVDGVHPNDLGMMRQAAAVTAALRPLLRGSRTVASS